LLIDRLRARIPRRYHYPLRQLSYEIRALRYRGNRVWCPWCQKSFRSFIQYGSPILLHLNTFCPRCGAFERHRLLWLYWTSQTRIQTTPCNFLHVAPEYMLQKTFRAICRTRYVSLDYCSSLAMLHADLTALPLPNDQFDIILCSHVLEHIPADRQAMAELYRVLRPGGQAFLLVPVDWTRAVSLEDPHVVDPVERARIFGQHDHVRLYGRDYIDRLSEAGFQVCVDAYAATLDAAVVARYGINVREKIIIGRKPETS
jgi:SAM-dependent methyltransferase